MTVRVATLAAAAFASLISGAASAARSDALEALAPLLGSQQLPLEVNAEYADGESVEIDKAIELVVRAAETAYLRLILVDAHGQVELADPVVGPYGNRLEANVPVSLPGEVETSSILQARPPDGAADLFIVATEEPMPPPSAPPGRSENAWMLDATAGASVAGDLAAAVAAGKCGRAGIRRFTFTITTPGGRANYTVQQIERYFAEQTRGTCDAKLDLYVNFEFDSVELTSDSLPRLDTWGQALTGPFLAPFRFRLGGHTDDIGTDEYNLELSLRRAEKVKALLVQRYGVDPERLAVEGYGKRQPLYRGDTEEARALNRRVDFERLTSCNR